MKRFVILVTSVLLSYSAKAESVDGFHSSDSVVHKEQEALRIVDELFLHRYSSALKHVLPKVGFYWCTERGLECEKNFIDTYAEQFTPEYQKLLSEGELKVSYHAPAPGLVCDQLEPASIELFWSYYDDNGWPGTTRMLFILDDSCVKLVSIERFN